jgi:coniferyl-aldehyde dehydrogenase
MDQSVGRSGGTEMDLQAALDRQRRAFDAAPMPPADQRQAALRRLEALLRDNRAAFVAAIHADFGGRSEVETLLSEVLPTLAACAHARRHLAGWMRRRRRMVSMNFWPARNWVDTKPLGVVGIVAPWNYPVFLTLGPLIDVLAAGNRAMIKPSEFTPATSDLLARLLAGSFSPEEVLVVQGGVETARAFCALPFDHLLYTGSTHIGRDIMRAAAENLVPVTLELGGKSPVIVDAGYDAADAARSVAVGKFFNAGQTCVAPDYALVPSQSAEAFAHGVIAASEAMYPSLDANPDYTAIISDRHYQRLCDLVAEAEAGGAIVLRHHSRGGGTARLFPPTVVLDPPLEGRLMRDEIFGPILPVIRTESTDAAITFVNRRPRPLALYAYTKDGNTERKILDRTMSGGVTINSTIMHTAQEDLPFGGVGPSGMGAYHGADGFYRFSHARGVHKRGFFSGFEYLRPPHGRVTRAVLRALGFPLSK